MSSQVEPERPEESSASFQFGCKPQTCLVRLPPRFMVPEPVLVVWSHSMTVEVSL